MTALPEQPFDEGAGASSDVPRPAVELAGLVGLLQNLGTMSPEVHELLARAGTVRAEPAGNVRALGRARKVSVSMPEGLTAAVQQRVGKGEFSQYVTEAVTRQLESDLLAELAALLDEEHGSVPEEFLAEAGAAWPDAR